MDCKNYKENDLEYCSTSCFDQVKKFGRSCDICHKILIKHSHIDYIVICKECYKKIFPKKSEPITIICKKK